MAWSKTCSGLGLGVLAASVTVDINDNTVKTRACQPPHDGYAFCDTTKSIENRVSDLISQLKDEEIPPLLTARAQDGGGGGSPGPSANISRLGLPEYDWGTNCIHGVQSSCVRLADGTVKCPTSFPNPVNFGATFNDSHSHAMGQVIGDELRALWVAGATEFSHWSGRPHVGFDCWSPNINIARDPRWGRNQEVPSEDPLVNGRFGSGYTRGLQEGSDVADDPDHVKAIVTLKHWDAYSLENSSGYTRHNFDANVSDYTLQDTFWPAWQMSVQEGKALGVMCSYNALNGVPTCADPFLKHVLRDVWGFDGYVSSDTGALSDIYEQDKHNYVSTKEEAVCAALVDGGTDISSDHLYHDALLSAIQKGLCDRSAMETALRNTLTLRFKLGLFDGTGSSYWNVPMSVVGENEDLVRLSTLESMVLLSNTENTLPLTAGLKLAVMGPHSEARTALVGNYLGQLCPDTDSASCVESPLEAFKRFNAGGVTTYTAGSHLDDDDESGFPDAVAAAHSADAVVLMLGIDESIEKESHDRVEIDLPAVQHALAAAVLAVGKPTVIVLVNGGMVAVRPERDAKGPVAILEAFYPGMLGAEAIASTIFGENQHLGGKLPITIYDASHINDIEMTEMEMDTGVGRTYKYFTGEPTFAFGHGISLTSFSLETRSSSLSLDTQGEKQQITVKVTNTGARVGDEVVQVYFEPKDTEAASSLIRQLIDYKRVHLQPGESASVTFEIAAARLRQVRRNGNAVAIPGSYDLVLTNGVDQTVRIPTTLKGEEVVLEEFPSRPAKRAAALV